MHSEVDAAIKQMAEEKVRRDEKQGVYSDCWMKVASG